MFKFIFEISLVRSFLNPKILFFIGKGGGGVVCTECYVMQEGSCEQT